MNQITPIVRRIDGELSLRVPVHRAEDLTDGGKPPASCWVIRSISCASPDWAS